MIRVRFFSSFCSSEVCAQRYTYIYENLISSESKIEYTSSDDFTHAVILNIAMPTEIFKLPKKNVIGLAFEPNTYLGLTKPFIDYAQKYISVYYLGDNSGLPKPTFVNHYAFMWHIPVPETIPQKTNCMSIIYSEKKETFGQQYRHILVSKILKMGLPIDIYGRGCSANASKDPRIKGQFSCVEPYDIYDFTIAIENCALSHYVSEKLLNALIYETTPLYFGAKCVDSRFKDQFIRLNGKIQEDLDIIVKILKDPQKYKKTNIKSQLIANKSNLKNHLEKIFV